MTLAQTTDLTGIINGLTWGTELEVSNYTPRHMAELMADIWGTDWDYIGTDEGDWSGYDKHGVVDPTGKRWTIVKDGSVCGGCEIVTPIMTIDASAPKAGDIGTLQDLVRQVTDRGARVSGDCGQHVHVGVGQLNPRVLQALVKVTFDSQDLISTMASGSTERAYEMRNSGCGATDLGQAMVTRVLAASSNWDDIAMAWYGLEEYNRDRLHTTSYTREKYHNSRYYGLNLHASFVEFYKDGVWTPRRTIEFRYFDAVKNTASNRRAVGNGRGRMHAGKVRANIMLSLHMVARAVYNVGQGRMPRAVRRSVDQTAVQTFCNWLRMYDGEVIDHLASAVPGEHANGHDHNRGRSTAVSGCACSYCEGAQGSATTCEAPMTYADDTDTDTDTDTPAAFAPNLAINAPLTPAVDRPSNYRDGCECSACVRYTTYQSARVGVA